VFVCLVLLQTLPSFSAPQVASGGDDAPAPAGAPRAGSVFRTGATSGEDSSSSAALASAAGGRALGGATRRGNADARSARLQALERNNAPEESSEV
jgi:hypothetical protein